MVLISKDRVHLKGTETEIFTDFCMLSVTLEKRFGLTVEAMQELVQIAHNDLYRLRIMTCKDVTPDPEETERTISVILTRGRGIFYL